MNRIDDIINGLSTEEQEQFKGLIDECKLREKSIDDSREMGLYYAEKLEKTRHKLTIKLNEINQEARRAKSNIADISLNLSYWSFDQECRIREKEDNCVFIERTSSMVATRKRQSREQALIFMGIYELQ